MSEYKKELFRMFRGYVSPLLPPGLCGAAKENGIDQIDAEHMQIIQDKRARKKNKHAEGAPSYQNPNSSKSALLDNHFYKDYNEDGLETNRVRRWLHEKNNGSIIRLSFPVRFFCL